MNVAKIAVNVSLAFVLACALYAVGGPIVTDDLWWHLAMGEVYATLGPWPGPDPLLHTAHAHAPVQHEWLFGVAVHWVDRALGPFGLRGVHALAVAGILWLAHSVFRRAGGSEATVLLATLLFTVLAWSRLYQFRPDLFSIAATLVLYRLLLEPEHPPSWRRVAAATGLLVVWANVHSLFAIGLLLVVAALLGLALQAILEHGLGGEGAGPGLRARALRLAAALALGTTATVLNPRGFGQHLTFVTSSLTTGVWSIADEWTHFNPFFPGRHAEGVGFLSWLATDALLLGFLAAAVGASRTLLRTRQRDALRSADPVRFGLGLASIVAILVSVRFLWMSVFPLLFLLRFGEGAVWRERLGGSRAQRLVAVASVWLALGFPWFTSWLSIASMQAQAGYTAPYVVDKYRLEGVRFLRDTGVEGNLFNTYNMGGFLAYWLSPRLRTFVDGRTEHYPRDVLSDYSAVTILRGARAGETHLDVLARRHVDLFFGVGVPLGLWTDGELHTAAQLEGARGWILVSRSLHHAIYLAVGERNRANLARIQEYYRRAGVPFDPVAGLDPAAVLSERPDWAAQHELLPADYAELFAAGRSPDSEIRFAALESLASIHALVGAYPSQLALDREARALRPDAKGPLRRSIYALLRMGRLHEAQASYEALASLDRGDQRSQAIGRVVAAMSRPGGAARVADGGPAGIAAVAEPLLRFPLFSASEIQALTARVDRAALE